MNNNMPMKLAKNRYFDRDLFFDISTHDVRHDYPLHWHDFYEIEYIISGHAQQILNGKPYEVGPGFISLISPSDFHEYKNVSDDDAILVYNIKFSSLLLPSKLQPIINGISQPLCVFAPEARHIMEQLLDEYDNQRFAREDYIISGITQLCIMIFRSGVNEPEQVKDFEWQSIIRQSVIYIREHFREHISVNNMAKIIHLTPNYFSEFFKKHMGIGYSAYVRMLRLEFTVNLLKTSDMSVKEIADKAGFTNITYFYYCFKNEYGMSPEQYKKSEKKD